MVVSVLDCKLEVLETEEQMMTQFEAVVCAKLLKRFQGTTFCLSADKSRNWFKREVTARGGSGNGTEVVPEK